MIDKVGLYKLSWLILIYYLIYKSPIKQQPLTTLEMVSLIIGACQLK